MHKHILCLKFLFFLHICYPSRFWKFYSHSFNRCWRVQLNRLTTGFSNTFFNVCMCSIAPDFPVDGHICRSKPFVCVCVCVCVVTLYSNCNYCLSLSLQIGQATGPPPMPEFVNPALKDFVLRCLEVNPKDRPTSAELLRHPLYRL